MGKILWVDTETGGLNAKKHSLLTVAFVVTDGVELDVIAEKEWKVKSDDYVVTFPALSVNNIEIAKHDSEAIGQQQVIFEMEEFIKEHFGDEKPIIAGHNVGFDIDFIDTLMFNNKKSIRRLFSYKVIDTCNLLRALGVIGVYNNDIFSLQGAVKYFDIKVGGEAHNALYDTLATIEVLKAIKSRYLKDGAFDV